MLEARRGIVLRPLRIPKVQQLQKLYGPSMFAVKAKINGVIYNQSSSIVFETSSYWSILKSFQFLGFSFATR